MKIIIGQEEFYDHTISGKCGVEVEVNANTVKKWQRILREYGEMQEELSELYDLEQ